METADSIKLYVFSSRDTGSLNKQGKLENLRIDTYEVPSPASFDEAHLEPETKLNKRMTPLPQLLTIGRNQNQNISKIKHLKKEKESANVLDICNCTTIIISSSNPSTISIHSGELGQYTLVGVKAGRTFYKHTSNRFFLYYHEGRGGNWLVNETPGLVYGGIQNSKDYPICPYLLSTVWQYGDSKLEGWVYDTSLQVTCPEDPCSILKCGFRAQCQITSGRASCICRPGYTGNPYTRCYPNLGSCTCKHLHLSTTGPALVHQRDKIGDYYLWGEYNEKPVYQHYSGLDFIYFHKNQVWGVGPKVGGKKVGLLNFSMVDCPYTTKEIWQYGTQNPGDLRQLDTLLKLECVE